MNKIALIVAALVLGTGAALAAPPTVEQQEQFYAQCLKNSLGNVSLCRCKADAAMTLIDSDFMAVVIASMSGGTPDSKYDVAYNNYIVASTKACGMGM